MWTYRNSRFLSRPISATGPCSWQGQTGLVLSGQGLSCLWGRAAHGQPHACSCCPHQWASIRWVLPATPEGLERWLWGRTSWSVCLCIGSRCLLLEAAERTHSGLKPERAVWAQHLWKPEMRQFWTFEIFLDAWQATAAVGNFCWEKTLRVAAYAWALGKTKQAMQGRCEQFGSAEVYKNGPGLIPSACLCISDS